MNTRLRLLLDLYRAAEEAHPTKKHALREQFILEVNKVQHEHLSLNRFQIEAFVKNAYIKEMRAENKRMNRGKP